MFPRFVAAFLFTVIVFSAGCTPEKLRDSSDSSIPSRERSPGSGSRAPAPRGDVASSADDYKTYLFCTWNVENFYDDQDDPKANDEMENWYGQNPAMFQLKISRLADVLTKMNSEKKT